MTTPRFPLRAALLGAALVLTAGAAAAQLPCGSVVTTDTVMIADLLCTSHDPALTVVGPATLDMDGHRVFGVNAGTGIALDGKGATLKNGAVRDFANGVRLGGGGKHKVQNVAASSNVANGFVIDSGNNRIVDSVARGNLMHGFLVFALVAPGGENLTVVANTITGSSAVNNKLRGFALSGAKGVYADNVATSNFDGGFQVGGTANVLSENVSSMNGGPGFDVTGTDTQLLDNLSAGDAGTAFQMPAQAGKKAKLLRNLAIDAHAGIAGGTDLRDNVVISTNGRGIDVAAPGHKLTGNTVVSAGEIGIFSHGGDSLVTKNRVFFTDEGTGLMIGVSPQVQISGNLALGSPIDVLDLDGTCDDHAWSDNVFTSSAQACVQ